MPIKTLGSLGKIRVGRVTGNTHIFFFGLSSICLVYMNVFAKFDEIPSIILEVIKETKRFGHTVGRTFGQRESSIPSHKHSLRGVCTYEGVCKI